MTDFGSKGFGTLEPNNASQEESITFSGVTANANGTYTLTGVKTVLFVDPYTETSGLAKSHPGGSKLIITNTSAYQAQFAAKGNDETITGLWDFPNGANTPTLGASYVAPTTPTQVASKGYVDATAIAGAPNASTTVQGLVQEASQSQVDNHTASGSTGAKVFATPAKLRATNINDYAVDTGSVNAVAIAPTVLTTIYTVGQVFTFKASKTNTGASTLAVNGLSAKNIFRNGQFALAAGDLKAGGIYAVEYDGTQFQLLSQSSLPKVSQTGAEIYGTSSSGTTAYVVGIVPAVTSYVAGLVLNIKPDTGGGHATLNVNSLGAKNIYRYNNGTLGPVSTGDIVANQVATVIYDGTQFQLQSTRGTTITVTSGVTSYDLSTASGTQTIAHGLSATPKFIELYGTGVMTVGTTGPMVSYGNYNGVTNNCAASNDTNSTSSASFAIYFRPSNNATEASQTGVVTLDAKNINIAWTKLNSPTGTGQILWKAYL